jgi:hypothetical protein
MGFRRPPREVYRTFSEEELLDDDTGVNQAPREPNADYGPGNGLTPIGARARMAARTRGILLTVLATLLGLAVGLAAVTLIDGGGLPHAGDPTQGANRAVPMPSAAGAPRALPPARRSRAHGRGDPHPAPRVRRLALAAVGPPVSHDPGIAPAPEDAVSSPTPVASGTSLVAREAGTEFGFER